MAADADGERRARVDHPLLEPDVLEDRGYQLRLAERALDGHTLVCLPTGLGKTAVSLLVTAQRLYADRRAAEGASGARHERSEGLDEASGEGRPGGGDESRGADAAGRALLLAPTKPLVEQHAAFYREALSIPDEEIVVFTGEVRPEDRADQWEDARVVVATPQVVENDLVGSRISLRRVVHCTFDECHRASGDYAYTYIAERYHADAAAPLVTGMSASPGSDADDVRRVCANLGIRDIEVMTEEDADVEEYAHGTEVDWQQIELPADVLEIRDLLNEVIEDRLERLAEMGVTNSTRPDVSQKDLNRMRRQLQSLIDDGESEGYEGMSIHAEVMKLRRAVELVETQSVEATVQYFERQRNAARSSGASKASQRLISEPRVKEAMRKAEDFEDIHPKYRRARMAIATALGVDGGDRVIVFTESRDTAETLTAFLGEHFETRRFVGQGDREGSDGMTQKEQKETLEAFRDGAFEVLVSTSVAEEGLDVPEVDLVLFYEPVPTAIRSIQRKGRTGRQDEGKVIVLMAEDTRDEAYFWIARRREQEMEEELRDLKGLAPEVEADLNGEETAEGEQVADEPRFQSDPEAPDGQAGLMDFDTAEGASESESASDPGSEPESEPASESAPGPEVAGQGGRDGNADGGEEAVVAEAEPGEDVEVVVDQRELDSTIARDLSTREGVEVRLETLEVGDYVLSDRVAVERKEVGDFLDSLTGGDRSVFEQVGDMARHYARPVVVLEGEGLYERRNIHPKAIQGAVASLAVDFGASVLHTADADGTTDLLAVIAEREQEREDRAVSVHGEKAAKTLGEQQEYVVSSIADIGPVTARALLEAFGSVEAVLTADEEDLLETDGVGEVTADRIREVVGSEYEG
jgi:Fanconi anemia group M protein